MEAGNRCFDMRVPEEINRRIVDHTSDVNMTYSDIAREYLLREGISPDLVIKTGSPMREVIAYYRSLIDGSDVLGRLGLEEDRYFVVSVHREENVDNEYNLRRIHDALNRIAECYGHPIIVSTHPRTQKRINAIGLNFNPLVRLLKPLGFPDYVHLQIRAKSTLSDSGTITEESSILNFPALNLREAHERPEGMEMASVMMVGLDVNRILQGLSILESQSRGPVRLLEMVRDYDAVNVSDKVVRIIHSYVDYVQRVVWRKAYR
jgi:UDP-N-acetylglucosamine 2-epimerase (non-hydrolysing)